MKHFYLLWSLLDKGQRLYFFYMVFLMLIQAILEILSIALVIPFTALILDPSQKTDLLILDNLSFLIESYERESLLPICAAIFFIIFVIKNISLVFIYSSIYNYTKNVRAIISTKLLSKYLKQNYEYFVKNSFSKIQANLTGEINALLNSFFIPAHIILSEVIIFISIFFLLFLTNNIQGVLIVLPTLIIVGFILKKVNKNIKKLGSDRLINNRDNAKLTHYILLGVRDILLIGKTKKILEYFNKLQLKMGSVEGNLNVLKLLPKNLIEVFGLLTFLILIIYLFNQGEDNDQIITVLTFYFVIAYRILPSINKIFSNYQVVKFAKNSVSIIGKDLNLEDKIEINDDQDQKFDFQDNIVLSNINFEYEKNIRVLNNINLKINKNEIVGIKGDSGSGKTTLLNIISKLSSPTYGKILIDNRILNIKKDIRSYQNLISLISQDTFLIEGSVKENILLGTEKEFDEKKFQFSLDFSKVQDFLELLPNGIDTIIGTNSKSISSGQKQRIAIARQIYSDREILIFDEATNALDEKNEKIILNNIMSLKPNKTIILVSHNSENLKVCDKIYYLEGGNLIEKNHD
jgi:ATP-binding cassette, subfamily B, bacterial PglK